MLRYLPFVLLLAVWIYAFIDCLNTPEKEVRKLPKLAWVVIILLFGQVLLGPIVWFAVGRPRKNAPYGATSPQERRWVAPDDNPDFLKSINDPKQQPEPQADQDQETSRGREGGAQEPAGEAEADAAPEPSPGEDTGKKNKRWGWGGNKAGGKGAAPGEDSHLRNWEDDLRRREDELRRRERGTGPEDTPPGG